MTLMVTWLRCWTWNWNWTLAVVGSQILCSWCGSHFLLCSTPLSHRKPGPKPVVLRCQWRVSHIHSYYSHGHISHPLTQLSLTPPRPLFFLSAAGLRAAFACSTYGRAAFRLCSRCTRSDNIFFLFSVSFIFLLFGIYNAACQGAACLRRERGWGVCLEARWRCRCLCICNGGQHS